VKDPFIIKRRVAFSEVDLAGVVHFSRYFRYLEDAEHAFFRARSLSILADAEGNKIGWPRVNCSFDYHGPLHFEQEFEIRFSIEKMGKKSITGVVQIFAGDKKVAEGRSTNVCCEMVNGVLGKAITIPDSLREKLQ